LLGAALAQGQFGTADEAKAMLQKAVAAVKADRAKAIDMFIKGEGGFKDRDLYPFCANIGDGKVLATQAKTLIGADGRTLKDKAGKAFGQELFEAGQKPEGTISEVSYMYSLGASIPLPFMTHSRPGQGSPIAVQQLPNCRQAKVICCSLGEHSKPSASSRSGTSSPGPHLVQMPTTLELVIYMKTAKVIGHAVPEALVSNSSQLSPDSCGVSALIEC